MSALLTPGVEVRRGDARLASRLSWLDSKHSFSLGTHRPDPANTHHGVLLVNNEDVVQPGTGFETHPHRDMEIVTWVLQGSLVHQDSGGHPGVIYPGLAQRMSAGTGILHSEKNDTHRAAGGPPADPVPPHRRSPRRRPQPCAAPPRQDQGREARSHRPRQPPVRRWQD
uniref:pirin family protein n=1 Tax=Streptomyces sp. GbtcB6 TaxID=2824751 RepID=UPI001C2F14F9